jgi:hypothetical protein
VAAYCKSALAAAETHLTASQAAQFKSYCASFAHDNPAQIKASEKSLCNEIIKDTVPAADRTLAGSVCAKLEWDVPPGGAWLLRCAPLPTPPPITVIRADPPAPAGVGSTRADAVVSQAPCRKKPARIGRGPAL